MGIYVESAGGSRVLQKKRNKKCANTHKRGQQEPFEKWEKRKKIGP